MRGALSHDLARGTTGDTLESVLMQFLNGVRMAPTLAEVNVAAGIAYDAVNAIIALAGHSVAA